MGQYKLLEILDQNTLAEVTNIFGNNNIFKFTDNIVGIKYDYNRMSYTDVLRNVIGLNLRQWTITSNRFIDIISYSITNSLHLGPIVFSEFIDSNQTDKIKNIITKINMTFDSENKLQLKEALINNLEWLMLDECIDIQSIVISHMIPTPPFNVDTRFFNNGVLFVEEHDTLENLRVLFMDCFSRR
ncbi:hypothetical protein [Clostridioides sp. ZZV14-6387]|uniref:hypothetical protein n=1 Tax=Clostridioides sp. ZZV14-6387 TaxID=2811497 RepID=UPI001D10474E|nr:hypothetical protein [Clostridioides sp. ZZV14-6387]